MDEDKIGEICHDISQIFSKNKMTFSDVVTAFHSMMIYALDVDESIPSGTDTARASFESPLGNSIQIITTFILDRHDKH